MSDWKGIVKKGWHPEKDGTSLKDQVKGLVGRGDTSSTSSSSRDPMPISSLRDPSSFGPPPKHVGYGGNAIRPPPPIPPRHGGYDGPPQQPRQAIEEPPLPPPPVEHRPYRVDTTGLDTSHLPPPPARGSGRTSPLLPPPPPYSATASKPPALPPRLPPRSNTASPVPTSAQQQQQQTPVSTGSGQSSGFLNQGAVGRLGAAGISVPGLGIGTTSTTKTPLLPPPVRSSTPSSGPLHHNDLPSRFSRPGTSDPPPAQGGGGGGGGTTWAQKQAALKTASDLHRDPRSVSLADARAAAATANNFRQRHGDQVAAGARTASALNQRYGVADKIAAAGSNHNHNNGGGGGGGGEHSPLAQISGVLGKKKPAPPPPKKRDIGGAEPAPPPVPLATRPKFG